jgi:hypothetical protein
MLRWHFRSVERPLLFTTLRPSQEAAEKATEAADEAAETAENDANSATKAA